MSSARTLSPHRRGPVELRDWSWFVRCRCGAGFDTNTSRDRVIEMHAAHEADPEPYLRGMDEVRCRAEAITAASNDGGSSALT